MRRQRRLTASLLLPDLVTLARLATKPTTDVHMVIAGRTRNPTTLASVADVAIIVHGAERIVSIFFISLCAPELGRAVK